MKKTFTGKVVSIKQQKTAVVEVIRRTPHPMYKKLIRTGKRFQVDTGDFTPEVGESVKITEIRQISKNKYFKIMEVIKK